ncbi:MAG TPA: hypothetical protein ENH82_03965 [bacterium]|nr:hypothetical protein [bacterium]
MTAYYIKIGADTPGTNNDWTRLTSVRVNGSSNTTGVTYADDIIKDILGDFAPSMSTDYSSISTGGTEITTFYAEDPTTPLELIDMAASAEDWKTGVFGVGSDDKPQWTGTLLDRASIDWTVTQDEGDLDLAGKSLQEMYNSVVVEYDSPAGEVLTLTRTVNVPLLNNAGITRKARIRVQTESVATAENSGDAFLAEFGRERSKGQMIIHGQALYKTGIKPAWYMQPHEIIQIQDLNPDPDSLTDMSSDPVTNGQNIFEIVGVDVDVSTRQVIIQLDTPASRLDYELVS